MTKRRSTVSNEHPAVPSLWALEGGSPTVDPTAWIAPNATLVGRVHISKSAGIWYNAVLRAEFEDITIGEGSNLQDGVVAHVDPGFPLTVGANVTVGHNAVLHGCTVGDGSLIGMGSVIMNGAVIGAGSLVAAGALVTEGTQVPPGSLIAGVPGKVRRELTEQESAHGATSALVYQELAKRHRAAKPV